jgi:hypothetical protein
MSCGTAKNLRLDWLRRLRLGRDRRRYRTLLADLSVASAHALLILLARFDFRLEEVGELLDFIE